MGLNDRDYMRDVPIYKALTGRSPLAPPPFSTGTAPGRGSPPIDIPRSPARRRAGAGLAAAVTVSLLAALVMHRLPATVLRGGPHHDIGFSIPHSFALGGPTTARVGDLLTERGVLPAGVSGTVVLLARWNGGPWLNVATSTTNQGPFFLSFKVAQPGVVDLQLNLPNGDQGTTTITVGGASVGSAAWPIPNGTA